MCTVYKLAIQQMRERTKKASRLREEEVIDKWRAHLMTFDRLERFENIFLSRISIEKGRRAIAALYDQR